MPLTATTEPGSSQEPETQLGLPTGWQEPRYYGPSSVVSQWETEAGLKSEHANIECKHPKQQLNPLQYNILFSLLLLLLDQFL